MLLFRPHLATACSGKCPPHSDDTYSRRTHRHRRETYKVLFVAAYDRVTRPLSACASYFVFLSNPRDLTEIGFYLTLSTLGSTNWQFRFTSHVSTQQSRLCNTHFILFRRAHSKLAWPKQDDHVSRWVERSEPHNFFSLGWLEREKTVTVLDVYIRNPHSNSTMAICT